MRLMHQILAQEEEDEFKDYFKGSSDPKILITTTQRAPGVSLNANAQKIYEFVKEFCDIFPGSTFVKRKPQFSLSSIADICINKGFTDIMILHENKKVVGKFDYIKLKMG